MPAFEYSSEKTIALDRLNPKTSFAPSRVYNLFKIDIFRFSWSFGVVFWELITLGASPYPGMNSYEVVSFLQDGYRMDKPKHCADEM